MTNHRAPPNPRGIVGTSAQAGHAAGRAALNLLLEATHSPADHHAWLGGFLSGFLEEPDRSAPGRRSSGSGIIEAAIAPQASRELSPRLFAARIVDVSPIAPSSVLQVTLDTAGRGVSHRPGSCLALWPSNDPNTVRDVLRALSLNAQAEIPTVWGKFPIWQVLLEHLSLRACSSSVESLLAKYAGNPNESRRQNQRGQVIDAKKHSLLTLLRRYPDARPPIHYLLSQLTPIEPMLVPIAAASDDSRTITFVANSSEDVAAWGHVPVSTLTQLRVGEWVTLRTEVVQSLALPREPLHPTIVIASPVGAALAFAFAAARQVSKTRGRTWVIVVTEEGHSVPFEREFLAMHKNGHLGRFDVLRGSMLEQPQKLLSYQEEPLWRWLVDQSCLCIALESKHQASAFDSWLVDLFERRANLSQFGAANRVEELERESRIVRLTM